MNIQPKTRTEWFALVEEFERSNLTQVNFCKQKDLVLSRFTYYVQIYRQIKKPIQQKASTFSPVVISQSSIAATEIKIELPNGLNCRVASTISPDLLKKVLGVLIACS